MSLKHQITEDMKSAMRAKDSARLTAIRMLTAAIKQKEVDERIELSDAQVLAIVEKQIKQRRDSIAAYKQAQRQDLVEQEQFEADVLAEYLPLQLGESEIIDIINAAKASTGASSPQDIGKLMAVVKPQLAGKADMSRVSALVKAALAA
jgi:uncharacterized protein YqeY